MLRKLDHSPITAHQFRNRPFYIKRDDLLHPLFSGNKARKFSSLLASDFDQIKTIVSYGSAQANSLYSLAALAQIKQIQLQFVVQHIPKWLKHQPIGNYRAALNLGAQIIDLSAQGATDRELHPRDYIEKYLANEDRTLVIPEGGRSPMAKSGIYSLGQELLDWINENNIENPIIALPSGTGTTALYLQEFLFPHNIEVLTCACVGGVHYLLQQFDELEGTHRPTILNLDKKHHFGHLYIEDYLVWRELKQQTQVEFDLLYDPLMWHCLQPWLEDNSEHTLIYIHQGGLLGNESMAKRYTRKLLRSQVEN